MFEPQSPPYSHIVTVLKSPRARFSQGRSRLCLALGLTSRRDRKPTKKAWFIDSSQGGSRLAQLFSRDMVNKLIGLHFEGVSEFHNHVERGNLDSAFDNAHGVPVQVGFFRQFLLRNTSLAAQLAQPSGKEPSRVFGSQSRNDEFLTSERLHSKVWHSIMCYTLCRGNILHCVLG